MSDVQKSFYVGDDEFVVEVADVSPPRRSRDRWQPDDPGEIELADFVKVRRDARADGTCAVETEISLKEFIELWAEETGRDVREAERRLDDEMFDLAMEDARDRWESAMEDRASDRDDR